MVSILFAIVVGGETGPRMAIKGWQNRSGVGAAVRSSVKRAIVIEVGHHGVPELHLD